MKDGDPQYAVGKRLRYLRSDLRKLRETAGLSLQVLAKQSGLSKSMISKFELGQRDLSPDAVERLKGAIFKAVGAKMVTQGIKTSVTDPVYREKFNRLMEITSRTVRIESIFEKLFAAAEKMQAQRNPIVKVLDGLSKGQQDTVLKEWHDAEVAASAACEKVQAARWNFLSEEGKRLLSELFPTRYTQSIEDRAIPVKEP